MREREGLNLPRAYAKGLAWHGCGHALYHPVPTESMRAPCVGYFDSRGKWHLITSLTGQAEDSQWKRSDYTLLENAAKKRPAATHHWGPKHSSDVYDTSVGLTAGTPDLSAAGIPAQFSIDTRFRTASNFGAFLITKPPVAHEDLNEGFNGQYREWIQENFNRLYQNGKEELERYGLWIITETYSTQACMIQTWTGKTLEVKLDLKANAMMAGEFGPSFDTSRDRFGGAVNFHAHEDPGGRLVVFCDGLRYNLKRWKAFRYEPHLASETHYSSPRKARYDYLEGSSGLLLEPVGGMMGSLQQSSTLSLPCYADDGVAFDVRESRILDSDIDEDYSDGSEDEQCDDEDSVTKPHQHNSGTDAHLMFAEAGPLGSPSNTCSEDKVASVMMLPAGNNILTGPHPVEASAFPNIGQRDELLFMRQPTITEPLSSSSPFPPSEEHDFHSRNR